MNYQAGNEKKFWKFYKWIINYIKNDDKILNFGSGNKFEFEKYVLTKKNVNITSVDLLIKKPIYYVKHKQINKNVENKIIFKNKFDVITFFELIEHIDKTDTLLENCHNNLKEKGYLIFSMPNLASFYNRISLLFGYQPCVLEISNKYAGFGRGLFDLFYSGTNPSQKTIHHIRGITSKAMDEMLEYNKFKIVKKIGYSKFLEKIFYFLPNLSPVCIYICKKNNIITN